MESRTSDTIKRYHAFLVDLSKHKTVTRTEALNIAARHGVASNLTLIANRIGYLVVVGKDSRVYRYSVEVQDPQPGHARVLLDAFRKYTTKPKDAGSIFAAADVIVKPPMQRKAMVIAPQKEVATAIGLVFLGVILAALLIFIGHLIG